MRQRIPLGRREDLHLELKPAEALDRPEVIGRVVVAMLNAEGGDIWIGVRDQGGTAVELQGIPEANRAAASLRDSLIDRLDPSPLPQEVQIEAVPQDDEISVLRVHVEPTKERGPYALVKSGGWHFPVRVGSRIRPMSRREIFRHLGRGSVDESGLDAAIEKVVSAREPSRDSMWLRFEPATEIEIDLRSPLFEELLADPAASGNRDTGWHFARASKPPQLRKERLHWGWEDALGVAVFADGGLSFKLALEALHRKGDPHEIWPLCLLEYPSSAFRLARKIYEGKLNDEDRIVADLAFFGIRGWKLRRGSPLTPSLFQMREPIEYPEPDEDLTWTKPLVFNYRELREAPDRCGFRLVRRAYEAFGLREKDMPPEYDHERGRLVLP